MAESGIRFRDFLSRCLKEAIRTTWDKADLGATVAGIIISVIVHFVPSWEHAMNNIAWEIPVACLASVGATPLACLIHQAEILLRGFAIGHFVWRVVEVRRLVRDSWESRGEGEDFEQGSAGTSTGRRIGRHGTGSAGVKSERGGAEQVLKGPAGGEMKAEATGGVANAGADFEELGAQSFDLR